MSVLDPHYAVAAGRNIDGHDRVVLFRHRLDGAFRLWDEFDGLYECPTFPHLRNRRAYHALGVCLPSRQNCPRSDPCIRAGPGDPDLIPNGGFAQIAFYEEDRRTFARLWVVPNRPVGALPPAFMLDPRGRRVPNTFTGGGDPRQSPCGQWYWESVRVLDGATPLWYAADPCRG